MSIHTVPGEMRRVPLAAMVMAFALLAGCADTQLMPTPNLYTQGGDNPFANVEPVFRSNKVDVLYLTDRLPTNDDLAHRTYNYQRSRSMAFGISQVQFGNNVTWDELVKASTSKLRGLNLEVTVPSTRELGRFQPTPQNLLAAPGSQEEADDRAAQRAAEALFTSTLSAMLRQTHLKEVFVSVHGVANQHTDSVSRIAQIWHFFGRAGVPIAYSWPAGSPGLKAYLYDRESSEFTVYHLKQALKLIAACPDVAKINIIGHSRGTDVVASALRELHIEYVAAGKSPRAELKLGTVVLAAPDMDLQVTLQRNATDQVGHDPEQFVLYTGKEDKLLEMSSWLFGGLGRLGEMKAEMFSREELQYFRQSQTPEIVEAKISETGSFGHDYFVSNPAVSSDLILAVLHGYRPGTPNRPLGVDKTSGFWVIDDNYPARASMRPGAVPATATAPAK